MKWLVFLILASCASAPLGYKEREAKCIQTMIRKKIPVCTDPRDFDDMDPYELGWELGFRTGYLEGCVDKP